MLHACVSYHRDTGGDSQRCGQEIESPTMAVKRRVLFANDWYELQGAKRADTKHCNNVNFQPQSLPY
jgi:hypothetical protein